MIIYPAIDIKEGKCVRLLQGKAEDQTIYGNDPVEMAQKWENLGAKFLHVVDLDGAFHGHSENFSIIRNMADKVSIPIQLGGGIRSMDKISQLLDEIGVSRVILGTSAVEDPTLLEQAINRYGSAIAVGIDAKNGKVAVKGWVEEKDITAVELGKRIKSIGVETIIYTDISRDGMMTGPNVEATKIMVQETGLNVIASGGISGIKDIRCVKDIGAAGAIIGKALYTGAIDLREALEFEEE